MKIQCGSVEFFPYFFWKSTEQFTGGMILDVKSLSTLSLENTFSRSNNFLTNNDLQRKLDTSKIVQITENINWSLYSDP